MGKKNINSEKKNKNRNRIQAVKITLRNNLISKKSELSDEVHKEKNYSDYITDIFNSRIIYMIIVYMNKNKEKLKYHEYDIQEYISMQANDITEICQNYLSPLFSIFRSIIINNFFFFFLNNFFSYFFLNIGLI